MRGRPAWFRYDSRSARITQPALTSLVTRSDVSLDFTLGILHASTWCVVREPVEGWFGCRVFISIGTALPRWLDVLVQAEQVARIVLGFQRDQALVVGAVEGLRPLLVAGEVGVAFTRRGWTGGCST